MKRRHGTGLVAAMAAIMWVGAIVSGATLCVMESIGTVEREIAKVRAEAAVQSALALARERVDEGGGEGFRGGVAMEDAEAEFAVSEASEERGFRVEIHALGRGRNDIAWKEEAVVTLPARAE